MYNSRYSSDLDDDDCTDNNSAFSSADRIWRWLWFPASSGRVIMLADDWFILGWKETDELLGNSTVCFKFVQNINDHSSAVTSHHVVMLAVFCFESFFEMESRLLISFLYMATALFTLLSSDLVIVVSPDSVFSIGQTYTEAGRPTEQ